MKTTIIFNFSYHFNAQVSDVEISPEQVLHIPRNDDIIGIHRNMVSEKEWKWFRIDDDDIVFFHVIECCYEYTKDELHIAIRLTD